MTHLAEVFGESPKSSVPSLAQMIRDSRGDQQLLRRMTAAALDAWFRQSERLNIARRVYRLRGDRFLDFARRLGVSDQKSAYLLVHLHGYRRQILARCKDQEARAAKRGEIFRYPGWEAALGWFHTGQRSSGRFWQTPPELYRKLNSEFQFDFDPFPYPLPRGWNALVMDWGRSNYINPPFRKGDAVGKGGAMAFVRKAIEEQRKGKTSVVVMPVHDYVTELLQAGAELRPLGRLPFLEVDSGEPAVHPPNVALFILRGKKSNPKRGA